MLCQICGAPNLEGRERCARCGNKLLVVSGAADEIPEPTEEQYFQAQEELEEHLIERISALEEGLRQLSEAVAATGERLAQVEHNLTVTYTGVEVLGDLLETHDVLTRTELVDGWEEAVDRELQSRDLSRRFRERSQRILSHAAHSGHATPEFRRQLRALELALVSREPESISLQLAELARRAPDNDELWGFIGEVAFETADLESARVAFRKVLELRGPHYETLIYLGTVHSDLGEWTEAERVLDEALRLHPGSFLPLFTLGAMEIVRGRFREAVGHLTAAAAAEEAPQALFLLGLAHLKMHRPGLAITALSRAAELKPDFDEALYQLGVAYLRRGWTRRALATFREVLDLDPQRLQYQEAVRLLSLKTPENLPPKVRALLQRADAALERGRPEAALELYSCAVDEAPDQAGVRASAALLASALGRTRKAVGHSHHLLRHNPGTSPYRAAAVVALLEALRGADRPRAAARLARRLYRESEDNLAKGLTAYELALAESEIGDDLELARDLAREALDVTPRELRHYPLAALGEIALKRGRFREAVQYLEQATSSAPHPVLLRQLALARLGAGDSEGAETALEASRGSAPSGLTEELLGHVQRLSGLLTSLNDHARTNRNRPRGG